MDCLSRYAEGQLPEKICITDFQDRYACVENEKNSVLRANRENAGQWERFFLIRLEGNRIALLSSNGRFVSADTNKESNLVAVSQALGQREQFELHDILDDYVCLLYTSPSPRDGLLSRMPSSA